MDLSRLPLRALGTAALLLGIGCSSQPVKPATTPQPSSAAEGSFAQGIQAFRQGDSVRAEQYIAVAIEQGFDEGRALPWLLRACLRNARLRSALGYAEPYLRHHPEADELRLLVGTLRLSLGQRAAALRHARHLLRREPDSAEAHYLAGLSEPDASIAATAHLQEYLRLAPSGEHSSEIENLLADWQEAGLDSRREGSEGVNDSE